MYKTSPEVICPDNKYHNQFDEYMVCLICGAEGIIES